MEEDISIINSNTRNEKVRNFFNKNNYKIQTKIFKNCEHRIPTEGSSLGLEFLKNNLY